ncbi:porin [Defluviimonas sp. WL0075]|uniref:Porin n=1 Tax=Albidovulum sediminicola TaxID=2984331 RepID=A0ABT2YZL4_9RHOB|nr:porin [Defluviimonas sp. WL0075]MCV2863941.1 porin [Defluviimonas sp. WL0075]
MKKVLLASTALLGFAGAAAAEVSLSGYAEMGIFGGSDVETQFHNDIVINFNMSGSTDNGLEFGAKVQLDDTNGSHTPNGLPKFDDEAVWVSGSFGKITLGETDGAYDWALQEIYSGTSLFDDHSTHAGAYWFTGLDGAYDNQIMRYEYSFGDFAVAISAEQDDGRTSTLGSCGYDGVTFLCLKQTMTSGRATGDTILSIGGKWSGSLSGADVQVGVGYTTANDVDEWGVSAAASLANGFSVNAGYADFSATGVSADWWGLGAAYTTGALLVGVNYGEYGGDAMGSGFGLVVNYDLGGGAVAMLGYGSSSDGGSSFNGNGEDTFSAGLGLSF